MDTTYSYPHLFDIDDSDLFHGLNLSDNTSPSQPPNTQQSMYIKHQEDIYSNTTTTTSNNNNSYLQYLQSTNNNPNANNNANTSLMNNDFFYDTQLMMMIPPNAPNTTMDLIDYDYFSSNNHLLDQQQQKQQYNWLYDPIDTFLPQQQQQQQQTLFSDGLNIDSIMSENLDENITVEGGMSRGYVSLSVKYYIIQI